MYYSNIHYSNVIIIKTVRSLNKLQLKFKQCVFNIGTYYTITSMYIEYIGLRRSVAEVLKFLRLLAAQAFAR